MIGDALFIVLGLAVLLIGGDLLVRGAVGLAKAAKVPTLLVSLTIIAFGTSAPELVVSVTAVLKHQPGLAVGNIVGASIANILLVLGLPALFHPMTTHVAGLRRHGFVLLLATAAFAAVAYSTGAMGPAIGAAFLVGICGYVAWLGVIARRERDPVISEVAEYCDKEGSGLAAALAYLACGLIGLPVGADLLVKYGASLIVAAGVRPEVIGLTIVAFGTTLPELATVGAAALRKHSEVAIGNVVGSIIFNLLAVGGAAGLAGGLAFDVATLRVELPVMILACAALAAFILAQRDLGRIAGLAFVGAYALFIGAIFIGGAAA
ncbi:MAG: calcium/sodium antiporter [Parvularculaceae bacterium]